MILFNKTTGIVEYDGPTVKFPGIDTYKHPEVAAEFEIRLTEAEQLAVFREKVTTCAGDALRLQGTIADASQITMLAMGSLLSQLKAGTAIEQIIDSDPAFGLCIDYFAAQQAGTMKIPFKVKPEGAAMSDIIQRTHAVAELYIDQTS
ncbi:MAG: hypothetical protein ACI8WB_001725 [Phenylobacterium sp.]|jgi:hypothetical protein